MECRKDYVVPLSMNRALIRRLLECGGKGAKGRDTALTFESPSTRIESGGGVRPRSPKLCRRTPQGGSLPTAPLRIMGSLVIGFCVDPRSSAGSLCSWRRSAVYRRSSVT